MSKILTDDASVVFHGMLLMATCTKYRGVERVTGMIDNDVVIRDTTYRPAAEVLIQLKELVGGARRSARLSVVA